MERTLIRRNRSFLIATVIQPSAVSSLSPARGSSHLLCLPCPPVASGGIALVMFCIKFDMPLLAISYKLRKCMSKKDRFCDHSFLWGASSRNLTFTFFDMSVICTYIMIYLVGPTPTLIWQRGPRSSVRSRTITTMASPWQRGPRRRALRPWPTPRRIREEILDSKFRLLHVSLTHYAQ